MSSNGLLLSLDLNGPDDIHTILARQHLAASHRNLRLYSEVVTLMEETLAARKRVFGWGDPDTVRAARTLGLDYLKTGQMPKCVLVRRDALAGSYKSFGPTHPFTSQLASELAQALSATNQLEDAVQSWQEAIKIDPENAKALFGLGKTLADQGRFEEALPRLRAAADLRPGEHLGRLAQREYEDTLEKLTQSSSAR